MILYDGDYKIAPDLQNMGYFYDAVHNHTVLVWHSFSPVLYGRTQIKNILFWFQKVWYTEDLVFGEWFALFLEFLIIP